LLAPKKFGANTLFVSHVQRQQHVQASLSLPVTSNLAGNILEFILVSSAVPFMLLLLCRTMVSVQVGAAEQNRDKHASQHQQHCKPWLTSQLAGMSGQRVTHGRASTYAQSAAQHWKRYSAQKT
jgi:hypothetical protein